MGNGNAINYTTTMMIVTSILVLVNFGGPWWVAVCAPQCIESFTHRILLVIFVYGLDGQ